MRSSSRASWLVDRGRTVAVGAVVGGSSPRRRVGRALLAPVLAPARGRGREAARGAALLLSPLEDPDAPGSWPSTCARRRAVALAAGVGWTALRPRRTRARVARLAAELGAAPPPGTLKDALAAALGDPTVDVLYWVPGGRRLRRRRRGAARAAGGDGDARSSAAAACSPSSSTMPPRFPGGELERLLGPAARLAIENEAAAGRGARPARRSCAPRARGSSRPATRRAGASSATCTTARSSACSPSSLDSALARAGADGELAAAALDDDRDEVDRAFSELRELAHGIYPAVLTEAGLEAALATLADVAPLAGRAAATSPTSASRAAVEAGAYVVVDEAIRDAAARRATAISVSAAVHDGRLVITAADDGAPREPSLVHVADRVGALGGAAGPRAHDLQRGDPMRVVVAEDAMLTREGLARLLGERGRRGRRPRPRTPTSCCARSRATRPDAAIVDIRMPPTHTDEGLVAAQRDPRRSTPTSRVLVLSQLRRARATRCGCSRSIPSASATCSRTASSTSPCSSTRCAGSPTARPSIDPTIVARLLGRRRQREPARRAHRARARGARAARRGPLQPRDRRSASSSPSAPSRPTSSRSS